MIRVQSDDVTIGGLTLIVRFEIISLLNGLQKV